MAFLILIILFFSVYQDARLLRAQDEVQYDKIFRYTTWQWAVFCFLLSLAALPIYLLRRQQFKSATQTSSVSFSAVIASDALGILLQWILGMMVFEIFMKAWALVYPRPSKDIGDLLVSAVFSLVWMIFLIYRTTSAYGPESFFNFTALRRVGKPLWKIVWLPAFLGIVFAFFSVVSLLSRSTQPSTPLSEILESTSYSMFAIFLAVALILAPLGEEIIFRGYFYRVLSILKGPGWAIVIVAGCFGLLHIEQYWGDWLAIGVVALLGLVLTFLRAWTQSTIASAVLHYVYNGGVTLLPVLFLAFSNTAFLEYQLKYDQLDFTAKERLLEESIQNDPDLAEAYNDLAWLYVQEGKKLEEALRLIDRALTYHPQNAAYLDTKGEILYRRGDFAEAAAIAEELVERNPEKEYFKEQLRKFREGMLIEQSI